MTLRDCLTAFGFRFVADGPDELIAYDKDTGIYVYLYSDRPTQVVYSGGHFPGCRTVGDLRRLIHLRGHTVPGDKWYPKTAEDDRTAEAIKWGRADSTPLEFSEAGK